MAFTTNEIVFIILTFLAGLLLGMILAPSGKRWKRRYEEERDLHAGLRTEHERLRHDYDARDRVVEVDRRHGDDVVVDVRRT